MLMSGCERCWRDAQAIALMRGADQQALYRELLASRSCTPEQQAGLAATQCPRCKRMTMHQYSGVCMACGKETAGQEEV
jgi:hypothetical protein